MLVFQGSYYNRGPQFFVPITSEYIGVHNYANVLNLDYYYNIFQPDVVILDAAEYVFRDAYFDSKAMSNIDFNPSLISNRTLSNTQRDDLLSECLKLPMKAALSVEYGTKVDTVTVDISIENIQYAYLMTETTVYDLNAADENSGSYTASYEHTNRQLNDSKVIFVLESGEKYYMDTTIN